MASRVIATNTTISGQNTAPKHVTAPNLAAAGATGHVVEHWGDGSYWDVTAGTPVSIDKLGITGTPRFQD